ncbi:MAG: SPOR domain-containing protein [Bordetella sp.]|uniref:SPOR domain-containing protein n=1 Tax=Bordetella sp. TaxID=28081 RepID=UPI003F7C875C
MASQRKASRSSAGSTLYGVLAGLLLGLAIAAVVAFYVTRAPMPFVDKASRQHEPGKLPDLSQVNPNQGLAGGTVTVPPVPGPSDAEDAASKKADDLGALIASLPAGDKQPAAAATPAPMAAASPSTPSTPAPAPAAKPAVSAPAPIVSLPPAAAPKPAPATASGEAYFLQAGAYKQSADAESARARILLLGLKAVVQRAEVNGVQWYRVRVGPYAKLDDMNRARVKLADNKIKSTIVRQ